MKTARIGSLLLVMTMTLLVACVTINIYFPTAQAEEAAEKIVKDVLGKDGETAPPAEDKGAWLDTEELRKVVGHIGGFFISSAQAAEPNFNVNTPEIRSLQARMRQRHRSLAPYYGSGAIGFTSNALVGFHDRGAIPLRDRNRVNSLVSAENSDRNALYRAIANANGHPEWEPDVRSTFAAKWVQEAGRGWWYQSGGNWRQK